MRHEPIELGLARKVARRRDAKRMIRNIMAAKQPVTAGPIPATHAVDEAFAGLSQTDRRPNNLSVVSQLAEQLKALDHQREQLAKLLRDIDVMDLAE